MAFGTRVLKYWVLAPSGYRILELCKGKSKLLAASALRLMRESFQAGSVYKTRLFSYPWENVYFLGSAVTKQEPRSQKCKTSMPLNILPRGSNVVPFWLWPIFCLWIIMSYPKKELHLSLWVETSLPSQHARTSRLVPTLRTISTLHPGGPGTEFMRPLGCQKMYCQCLDDQLT